MQSFDRTSYSLWGKTSSKNAILQWLPLLQHLEDTGEVVGLLWEHWLSDGQRELISTSFKKNVNYTYEYSKCSYAKKVAQFLGYIHDIGKATPVFQARRLYPSSKDLEDELKNKLESAGFTGISNYVPLDEKMGHHTLTGQVILYSAKVPIGICSIIGAHHGKPLESIGDECKNAYLTYFYQTEDDKSEVYKKWQKTQADIIEWALKKSGFTSVDDLPGISQPAQVLLCGLLIMADWIASNENYFPLIPIESDGVDNKSTRTEIGWNSWEKYGSKDLWTADYIGKNKLNQLFMARFGFSPNDMQKTLFETIYSCKNPGIFILESVMGSGKTEASLIGAEQLAYQTKKSGLFFGLPTQATANGIFPRVKKWLESLGHDVDEVFGIRLAHGKAQLNEEFINISHVEKNNFAQRDEEDTQKKFDSLIVNEWFSGRKKLILDDFVIGTVDQFLLASLKQKHLMLRHLGFSKKVVVEL